MSSGSPNIGCPETRDNNTMNTEPGLARVFVCLHDFRPGPVIVAVIPLKNPNLKLRRTDRQMEYRHALNTILVHGIGRKDVPLDQACLEHGFIGCLRPWSGLRDENYRELMTAIVSLRQSLAGRDDWPIELIAGIAGITRMAHCWGIDDTGMLRRNNLISDSDVAKLRHWTQRIESVVEQLLMGNDPIETYPDLFTNAG